MPEWEDAHRFIRTRKEIAARIVEQAFPEADSSEEAACGSGAPAEQSQAPFSLSNDPYAASLSKSDPYDIYRAEWGQKFNAAEFGPAPPKLEPPSRALLKEALEALAFCAGRFQWRIQNPVRGRILIQIGQREYTVDVWARDGSDAWRRGFERAGVFDPPATAVEKVTDMFDQLKRWGIVDEPDAGGGHAVQVGIDPGVVDKGGWLSEVMKIWNRGAVDH